MAAIFGAVGNVDESSFNNMNSVVKHRGSREFSEIVDDLFLGMRNFSSANPTHRVTTEKSDYTVLCDAEIFNFDELSRLLRDKNVSLQEPNSSQILAHLFDKARTAAE